MKRFICFALVGFFLISFVGAEENITILSNGTSQEINFSLMTLFYRGSAYEIYANSSNYSERVMNLYPIDVNYYNGSEYDPINTTIVSNSCEYDYCVRKGVYYADFSSLSNSSSLVKFLYNGSYITYAPIQLEYVSENETEVISNLSSIEGYSNGSKFTYLSIYGSGFDLEYEYWNNLLKEWLFIDNESVLPTPGISGDIYLRMNFELNTEDDLYFETNNESQRGNFTQWNGVDNIVDIRRIRAEDGAGGVYFTIMPPYATDSNGNSIDLEYELSNESGQEIISIFTPYDWLLNETRVYPIEVDPSVNLGRGDTTWWALYSENGDFYSSTESPYYFHSGNDVWNGYDQLSRSYVRWGLSSSEKNTLNNAQSIDELYVTIYDVAETGGSDDTIYFTLIDEDYPNDLTPNNAADDQDLWEKLRDTSYGSTILYDTAVGVIYNPVVGSYNALGITTTEALEYVDYVASYDDNLIVGFSGLETVGESDVKINGTGSGGYPTASILYTESSYCGDGTIDSGEQCDDGDTYSGDGCSSSCQIENGWTCSGEPSVCDPTCGDGLIRGTEECDDGDTSSGDGCDSSCDIEDGWSCSGQPSECEHEYDGIINVYIEDSLGNPMEGLYTYLNGGTGYITNDDGFKRYVLNNVPSGTPQTVQVRCSDQSTVCGSDSTFITYDGDEDSLYFTCDMCSSEEDLFIDKDELNFEDVGSNIQVNVTLHSIGMSETVDIDFRKICGGSRISLPTQSVSIFFGESEVVSFTSNFDGCQKIEVDLEEFPGEDDFSNNYIRDVFVIDPVKVYLDVDTGFSLVDSKIEDFIGDFAQGVSAAGESDLEVYVGKNADRSTLESNGWLVNDMVEYNGLREGLPYNGLIIKKLDGARPKLYAFGNDLDGTIAAVRRMVDLRETYLNEITLDEHHEDYLSKTDVDAISVFDYFHTDENDEFYKKNDADFANLVDNVLRKQTFNLAIKRVLTPNDQTSLRLKNVNHELSQKFKEFTNERPVVMSGGIFNDLFTMQDLGLKVAKDEKFKEYYRDTWLVEYAGGSNTECDDCPNYTFSDLVNNYWPALIGGVIMYANDSSEQEISDVDYVGYSLGGGVGIRSYEVYVGGKSNAGQYLNSSGNWTQFNLPSNSVKHMALIAPMGSFNSVIPSPVEYCLQVYGDEVNDILSGKGHISRDEVALALALASGDNLLNIGGFSFACAPMATAIWAFGETPKISYNTWEDLVDSIIKNSSDEDPDLSDISSFLIIRGGIPLLGSDGLIPNGDVDAIYNNVETYETYEKYEARVIWPHLEIFNRGPVYDPLISKFLNDESYTGSDYNYILNYYETL